MNTGIAPREEAPQLLPEVQFEGEPTEPEERARHRLRRLATSFAEVLATVAQMHRDEDWKYVSRDDGTPYASLADLLRDHMGISVAMARRYVQGARDYYLPLQELVVQGTPIQISAGDVAKLGTSGAHDVVEGVRAKVSGSESADEAAQIITDTVDEVKAQRVEARRESGNAAGGDAPLRREAGDVDEAGAAQREWESGGDAEVQMSPGEATVSGSDAYADLAGDDEGYVAQSGSTATSVPGLDDEYAGVMAGARTYDSEKECREGLDAQLAEVANALRVLSGMDATAMAALIEYDTRGVIVPCDDAVTQIYRLRSSVESSPWFMEHLA